MADIAMLDDSNFDEVIKSGVTLVDFLLSGVAPVKQLPLFLLKWLKIKI